jgi:hypothetical protein
MVNGRLKACRFAHNFPTESAPSPGRGFAAAAGWSPGIMRNSAWTRNIKITLTLYEYFLVLLEY